MGYAQIASQGLASAGKIYGAKMTENSDNAAAAMLQQEAGASVASGIQGAINDRRQANYVASDAMARAAAGGVSGSSPSVLSVTSQIKEQGEYKALTSIYQGEDRAAEIRSRADQYTAEGRAAMVGGWASGMSNVLQGGTTFYDKYGAGAPGSAPLAA